MGGLRSVSRTLSYTTPLAAYRSSSGNDASVADVTEEINLSGSKLAMNTVVLYVRGTAADQLRVMVEGGDDEWYQHSDISLAFAQAVVVVDNLPARRVKVQNIAVAGAVGIKEEHTE